MPSVTKTVGLHLSAEQAFELATDPVRFEQWLTLHKGWPQGTPSLAGEGEEFVQKMVILGMPADVNWKLEEKSAPSKLVLRGSGPMGAQLATTITVTANGSGAQVSYEAEFSGGGIQGPMGEMVTKKAGEEIDISLGKLKALAG